MSVASLLASVGLVGLFAVPLEAQDRQPVRPGPVDVSAAGVDIDPALLPYQIGSSCVQRIADQANGGCLEASSTPTWGVLFPYPGTNNTFDPTNGAFVGGGQDNQATGIFTTVGGGGGPFGGNIASADFATVIGGYANIATGRLATIAGGSSNEATDSLATIGGGRFNHAHGGGSTIGGGTINDASGGSATVGGGYRNSASGPFSTVGGGGGIKGGGNQASGTASTISGGRGNRATGHIAAIGGGARNIASGAFSTVAGGGNERQGNVASGNYAAVGGGGGSYYGPHNMAVGDFATIPGGWSNTALGNYSFAAGRRATANHAGSFVWADSQDTVLKTSSSADEFNVYCSGGARFFSDSDATTGVMLAPGAKMWSMISDRDTKENVEPVDVRDVLEKVAQLPMSTWNYRTQSDEVRHMGPMAQDFYAAFGLGLGETTIDTIDPDGVALAAIQGLHALVEEKDERIDELEARLERLEALVAESAGR